MKVLVLNCGSSSLKYQLIDMENEGVLAKGVVERIGIEYQAGIGQTWGTDALSQQALQRPLGLGVLTQSGANGYGIGLTGHFDVAMVLLAPVGSAFGLGQTQLHDLVAASGHTYCQQSHATAHTGPGR